MGKPCLLGAVDYRICSEINNLSHSGTIAVDNGDYHSLSQIEILGQFPGPRPPLPRGSRRSGVLRNLAQVTERISATVRCRHGAAFKTHLDLRQCLRGFEGLGSGRCGFRIRRVSIRA